MFKDLQEYYSKTEEPNVDVYSLESDLSNLLSNSAQSELIKVLLEKAVLENGYYIADEHQFWPGVRRYKFDKLNFNSIEELEQCAISYLQSRSKETSNILLKAKYNQMLWFSEMENKFEYGKASIDAYLQHIKEWNLLYNSEEKEYKVIENLRYLQKQCSKLNYRKEEFKTLLSELIDKHEVFPGRFVYYIIEVAYNMRKDLESAFNENCFVVLEKAFDLTSQSLNDDIYELAKKYGVYLKKSLKHWHEKVGHHYYQTALKRQEKNEGGDFLIPEFYGKAIRYFELAENKEMQAQLNKEYSKVKVDNPLKKISLKVPMGSELSNVFEQLEKNIQDYIEGLDTEGIIDFLSNNDLLMPKNVEASNQNSFLHYAKRTNLDINNNFNHRQTEHVIDPKQLHLQLFSIRMTGHALKHGIESNELTGIEFMEYLKNNTWLGTTNDGRNWLPLLKPGIDLFFKAYGEFIYNQEMRKDEFVLILDSLTTKMEGVFRLFARLKGINTTKVLDEKNKGTSDVETREIYLSDLLTDQYPEFKALFEENEYLFYKTVFLKDGYNIRNNIAHSFYKIENYTMDKLLLVMLSIIRIANHKID